MTDNGKNNHVTNINSQMNLSLSNNVPVHHINIILLASDIMLNHQTVKVLDTDVAYFSTSTIDGTNNSYELEFRQNVLIIGMSNNKHIVLRDYLRCKRVEALFPNTFVHTVNIYRNSIFDSDHLSDFEMNRDSNSRISIQQMEDTRWKINEIYVDHYRILDPYLTDKFKNSFLENMNNLAKSQVFHCYPQNPNKILVV